MSWGTKTMRKSEVTTRSGVCEFQAFYLPSKKVQREIMRASAKLSRDRACFERMVARNESSHRGLGWVERRALPSVNGMLRVRRPRTSWVAYARSGVFEITSGRGPRKGLRFRVEFEDCNGNVWELGFSQTVAAAKGKAERWQRSAECAEIVSGRIA